PFPTFLPRHCRCRPRPTLCHQTSYLRLQLADCLWPLLPPLDEKTELRSSPILRRPPQGREKAHPRRTCLILQRHSTSSPLQRTPYHRSLLRHAKSGRGEAGASQSNRRSGDQDSEPPAPTPSVLRFRPHLRRGYRPNGRFSPCGTLPRTLGGPATRWPGVPIFHPGPGSASIRRSIDLLESTHAACLSSPP